MLGREIRFILIAVLMASGLLTIPATSQAGTPNVIVCKGLAACADKGYSSHGYGAVYQESFWYSVPGHNCTNYAAYMLNHNGRHTFRPSGTGDARTWAAAAKAAGVPVSTSPRVGDIAWWPASTVGSPGHVGYVEKVYTDGSILLSEDRYGGDFYFKRVYRDNSYWPKGFIRHPQDDGTPKGTFTSATLTSLPDSTSLDKLTVAAYQHDSDSLLPRYSRDERMRVDLTETSGTSFTFTHQVDGVATTWSYFYRVPKGTYTVKITALNQGPNGTDAVLGTRTVTHSDPTRTTMSLVSSWSYKSHPTLTIKTVNTASAAVYPIGTLVIKDGSRELTRRTLSAASKGTRAVWMPTLSRGKHSIRVYFKPSTSAFKSSSVSKTITVK